MQLHASRLPGILQRCAPRHTLACSRAAARSISLSEAVALGVQSIASNSSHFISHFHFSSSSRHARTPRNVAQHFKFRQQQGAPAMQPRSNRSPIGHPAACAASS